MAIAEDDLTLADLTKKQREWLLAISRFSYYRGHKGFFSETGSPRHLKWPTANQLGAMGLIKSQPVAIGKTLCVLTPTGERILRETKRYHHTNKELLIDKRTGQFILDLETE